MSRIGIPCADVAPSETIAVIVAEARHELCKAIAEKLIADFGYHDLAGRIASGEYVSDPPAETAFAD